MKLNKKKRIVFIIGSMRRGGAERVISILANNYAECGWKVDILTVLDSSNDYKLNSDVNVIPICNEGVSRIRQLPKWLSSIRKYIKDKKPDRVVSFIASINIITILSCLGLNQHIIISERNDPKADGRSKLVRMGTFLLYPIAKKVVFQTKWAKSCFSKRIQNNSIIIPNPVNITTKASKNKEKKIVSVGRLVEQKNHELLIRAFSRVRDNFPQYKLYIYGEGTLRKYLTKLIEDLELQNHVFLPGNVSNIHENLSDAEMFVLSSNYEGLSNALLEAMMMGLPCISTNCAGSNEVITSDKDGILVPIGDETRLYQAITRLINYPEFTYEIAYSTRETVKQFKLNTVLKKWEEVIDNNGKR